MTREGENCLHYAESYHFSASVSNVLKQEGQHPLTGQRAANFRLLANQ